MATEHHFYADNLVDALREEGIPAAQIWELDGWKTNEQGYYWTNIFTGKHNGYDGVANGHKNHHTASSSYVPFTKNTRGQTKATAWVGVRDEHRLYQNRATGVPTICLSSAGPADYSSGSGVKEYIKKLSRSEAAGRQSSRDDDPKFYANRYTLNTEIVCDGVGGKINQDSWDLLILYNAALARLHDGDEHWNGFHAGYTRRKIDFRDGRYANAVQTIEQMWVEIAHVLGNDPVVPPVEPPIEPPEEETVYVEVEYSDGFNSNPSKRAAVVGFQGSMGEKGFKDDNTQDDVCGTDGKFGRGTERATKAFQASVGLPVTGKGDKFTRQEADKPT